MRKTLVVAVSSIAVLGSTGVALAVSGGSSPVIAGCATGHSRTLEDVHSNGAGLHCGRGTIKISWNAQGQPGPSGVVSTSNVNLVKTPETVTTGGSFSSLKTQVGTVRLNPGTYLVNVNFMAAPNATTTGDVFPSLFVYSGPAKSDFSNDTFNVGSGALENPNPAEVTDGDVIDSYFSGSAEITVPRGGETLYVYAFGYDSDAGSGTYTLDAATVTATALQVR
jgi:hypothetical protein